MITHIDPELWELVLTNRDYRLYITQQRFAYFALYYYSHYFSYKLADFHWQMFDDIDKLISGEVDEVAWIGFRECAKTSIAKMALGAMIARRVKKYINYDSYTAENSQAALFDVVTELQSNKRFIHDYGHLFKPPRKTVKLDDDEPEKKSIGSFITTNKIKVEAFTTQISARGRVYKQNRTDLFVFDDIENDITITMPKITKKILTHVDEVRSGMSNMAGVLYLGNYVSEDGVMSTIKERLENNPRKIVRFIPIMDEKGNIAWEDKYVATNEEAMRINANLPRDQHKISIEQKRADLGEAVFQKDMMLSPAASGDYFFDRGMVRRAMERAIHPMKEVGSFATWATYDPSHRYSAGADVAEGNGNDHSASGIFDHTRTPALWVGRYANNEVSTHQFAFALEKQVNQFGACFLMPEINQPGYAVLSTLINEIKYFNIYQREVINKTTGRKVKEWGWKALGGTVYEVANEFKDSFEKGEIEILDMALLKEMYHYTKMNVRDPQAQGLTQHFDLLRAAMLAWHGRKYATLSANDKKDMYKAPQRPDYVG